jgi:NitT/TauT family transport system substrate-binding protein
MKKIFIFVKIFVLLSLFGTLASPVAADSEPVHVKVAFTNYSLSNIYELLGLDKGIFRKHGVDLEVVRFVKGGPEAAAATVSGQVDMGSFGTPILMMIAKNVPIKIVVSPVVKGLSYALVGAKNIEKIEDLRGKTIVTGLVGSGSRQSTMKILNGHGLTEKDVVLVAAGINIDPVALLSSGQVDAVQVTTYPDVLRIVNQGAGHLLAEAQDYYGDYQHSYIFATDDFIKNHPETIVNYIKALRETYDYSLSHVDELVDKASEFINLDKKDIQAAYEKDFKRWELSLAVNLKGVENAVKILQELGEMDSDVVFDEKKFIDDRFLKEAKLP